MMTVEYSLTASQMLEYLFCPRFTYFEYVLNIPQNEGSRFKVEKGRTIHEKYRKQNPDYLRKKLGVKEKRTDVYLASPIGIRGIVDEILFFISPKLLGGTYSSIKGKGIKTIRKALCLNDLEIKRFDQDIFVKGIL